ncbi:MAG TPA: hypothetical protein VHQ65_08550 [Thermoanaerobaculia bacterium]|nr:hypothetical protein [Thermoanaerobaculia bacterium]
MSSSPPRPRRRGRLLAGLLLPAALLAAACGKQGDPAPPLRYTPQPGQDLVASQVGLEIELEMAYPKLTASGLALPGLDRVEVWQVVRQVPQAVPADSAGEPGAAADGSEAEGDEAGDQAAAESEDAAEGATAGAGDGGGTEPAPLEPLPAPAFETAATLRLTLEQPELDASIFGDRLVVRLPLSDTVPPVPQAYWFALRTSSGDDRSELSNQAILRPRLPPPPSPRGLQVTPGPDAVELSWEAAPDGLIGYNIYRREARSQRFAAPLAAVTPDVGTYRDDTAVQGQRYIYAVTAVAARGPLVESAVAETRELDYRDRYAPPAPGDLVALAEEGLVRLAWAAPAAPDVAGYRVLRRREGAADWQPLGDGLVAETELTDRAVEAGATYSWRVVAVDRDGNESEPAEVSTVAR